MFKKTFTTLALTAAIALPAFTQVSVRIYDPHRRDYHRWDDREARAYRAYWAERHREAEYREYARLRRQEQRDYWVWRHNHPRFR